MRARARIADKPRKYEKAILMIRINPNAIDLVEEESKLAFGFNIEYFGVEFALIFIAEYANCIIIFYFTFFLFC